MVNDDSGGTRRTMNDDSGGTQWTMNDDSGCEWRWQKWWMMNDVGGGGGVQRMMDDGFGCERWTMNADGSSGKQWMMVHGGSGGGDMVAVVNGEWWMVNGEWWMLMAAVVNDDSGG